MLDTGNDVYKEPPDKPHNVNPDESHAAAEVGNRFSDDIRMRSLPLGRSLEIADRLDTRESLFLWSCNVDIDLICFSTKQSAPVREKRRDDEDHKYHEDSDHAGTATSAISIVTHISLLCALS